LTSGSKDKTVLTRDIRSPINYIWKLNGHKQEICGLKWSFDEQQLASGGNDNKLFLWSLHSVNPIFKFNDHNAAVKALAWSPHQHGLLASGGGTADKTIRFWNSLDGRLLNTVDTGSQVCNLMFSKTVNELVSTHGYSQNQVTIWKYPTM
jgi:cell division cycle 20-like protein 1 (cofactor of APC complex)